GPRELKKAVCVPLNGRLIAPAPAKHGPEIAGSQLSQKIRSLAAGLDAPTPMALNELDGADIVNDEGPTLPAEMTGTISFCNRASTPRSKASRPANSVSLPRLRLHTRIGTPDFRSSMTRSMAIKIRDIGAPRPGANTRNA